MFVQVMREYNPRESPLLFHEAQMTMMKLHNIVLLVTLNADMFQGKQIVFINEDLVSLKHVSINSL